jgi:hypothetical protein
MVTFGSLVRVDVTRTQEGRRSEMIYRLFRAMAMLDSGIVCRACGNDVARKDELGMSESVCAGCRA